MPTLVLARLIATLQACNYYNHCLSKLSQICDLLMIEGASLIIDFHNFGYSLLALKPDLHA